MGRRDDESERRRRERSRIDSDLFEERGWKGRIEFDEVGGSSRKGIEEEVVSEKGEVDKLKLLGKKERGRKGKFEV